MVGTTRGGIGQDRPARGGDMRVGPIIAVPALLAERGLDPVRVFATVGLDPCLLDDPENRISFHDLGRLFAACSDATGCPHFALMAVERYGPDSLGAVGHEMRNSPTVGAALRKVQLHLHLNDRGAVMFLEHLDPERVALCYTIFWHDTHVTSLIYDAALAVAYKALCELCGPSWRPLDVQFTRRRPPATRPYQRCFGVRPTFDAQRSAIVFASSWLDHPVAGSDPVLHDMFEKAIAQIEVTETESLASQVRRALYPMVLNGTATMAGAARLFALHERTLRRRLEADGTTFHALLNDAKYEVAQQLLCDTRLQVAEVAAILGYANPGAFSRAFRGWSGSLPKRWRDRRTGRRPGGEPAA